MVPDQLLTIGELARRAGRRASSIRYYEQIGLLPEPGRIGGQRRYRPDSVRTLAVIDTAQRAGLSLDEIKALLGAAQGSGGAVEELRLIAARKVPQVTAMIERATLVRRWLEQASRCECPALEECALFSEDALS
jgi:MerR family transcriptional regulator, redox-sensitive transcriptional activator SoxR